MKVTMFYCNRCGKFFKFDPLHQLCPSCLGKDMLMGPYVVDEYEYDTFYRKEHYNRRR